MQSKNETTMWADIYKSLQLHSVGVTFKQFLLRPWEILIEQGQDTAMDCMDNDYLPLLPAQAKAALKIQRKWAEEESAQLAQKRHLRLVVSN